jgi:hypothetical protein
MSRSLGELDRFTLEEYERYLRLARECGYIFSAFEDLDSRSHTATYEILLRHDIDYSPEYIPRMAALEAASGIRATYCLQTDSRWYQIDSTESRGAITDLLRAGHSLGLHIDVSRIGSDAEAVSVAATAAEDLATRFQTPVRVVSFHMPSRRPVAHLVLPDGLVNTYERRFFDEIAYVSDSNHNWRGVDLARLLRERRHRRLQLLIHPFWWRERPRSMRAKMYQLATQLGVDVKEIVTPEQWQIMEELEGLASTTAATAE